MSFRWSGRRVLITGGSSGIGKHLAGELLRNGASVGIVADDPVKLHHAETELKQISSEVWTHPCDVSVLDDVRSMAGNYRRRFEAPEVLINNAGYAVYYTFEQTASDELQRLFQVNLVGAALVTREFLPDMIRTGGGHVVMMASIAGRIPMTPCGAYSASKHGLVALAELLAIETARFNVKLHVVCPGRVETDFFAHESFQTRAQRPETARTIPIGAVSRAVMTAVDRNRFMTYVPWYYGMLPWLAAAAPGIVKPFWHRLLTSRIDDVYAQTSDNPVE
jgi:short-subunit dehydrogenase